MWLRGGEGWVESGLKAKEGWLDVGARLSQAHEEVWDDSC